MMTPQQLYDTFREQYGEYVVPAICGVDKACRLNKRCSVVQSYPVIDFDGVKDCYCRGYCPTPASVDAVCVGGKRKYFCFVELKGWKSYLEHIDKQKRSVNETINKYNLSGKLFASKKLCEEITGLTDLFDNLPLVFILVTDIDINVSPMASFTNMLQSLAQTSTSKHYECVNGSKKMLKSEIKIQHDYVYCKDFDKHIASL